MYNDMPSLAGVADSVKLKDRYRTDAIALLATKEYSDNIRTSIESEQLKFADGNKYKVLPVDGRTVKLYEPSHQQEVGSSNVDKNRLQGDETIVISALRLQAAIATGTGVNDKADDTDVVTLEWYNIGSDEAYLSALLKDGNDTVEVAADETFPTGATVIGVSTVFAKRFPGFENGELHIQLAGSKTVLDKIPLSVFTQAENGVYQLANPRVINPDKNIEFELDFGDQNPVYADHNGTLSRIFVRAEIIGATTIPRGN